MIFCIISLFSVVFVCFQNPKLVLCGHLEGWGGKGGAGRSKREGDVCVPVADSYEYMAQTSTAL